MNDRNSHPIHNSDFTKMHSGYKNSSIMNKFKLLYNLSNKLNILYVEDDIMSQQEGESLFRDLFSSVDIAGDGKEGFDKYIEYIENNGKYYDLVITDINMPNVNGIELCKNIFQTNSEQKILVISAHEESIYLIDLINIGVAGFIHKPFEKKKILEILYETCTKIEDMVKNKEEVMLNNDFVWHSNSRLLTHEEDIINLCASETALLDLLISNRNLTFSIDEIFNAVYEDNYDKDLSIDSVKSLLKRVRKKVPNNLIKNVYGEGYRINQELLGNSA